ncbi:hypothetical protein ACLOJK_033332 [Asimina triloba]
MPAQDQAVLAVARAFNQGAYVCHAPSSTGFIGVGFAAKANAYAYKKLVASTYGPTSPKPVYLPSENSRIPPVDLQYLPSEVNPAVENATNQATPVQPFDARTPRGKGSWPSPSLEEEASVDDDLGQRVGASEQIPLRVDDNYQNDGTYSGAGHDTRPEEQLKRSTDPEAFAHAHKPDSKIERKVGEYLESATRKRDVRRSVRLRLEIADMDSLP